MTDALHGTLHLTGKALAYFAQLAEDRPNPFGAIVRPRCYRSGSGCGRWVGACTCHDEWMGGRDA